MNDNFLLAEIKVMNFDTKVKIIITNELRL